MEPWRTSRRLWKNYGRNIWGDHLNTYLEELLKKSLKETLKAYCETLQNNLSLSMYAIRKEFWNMFWMNLRWIQGENVEKIVGGTHRAICRSNPWEILNKCIEILLKYLEKFMQKFLGNPKLGRFLKKCSKGFLKEYLDKHSENPLRSSSRHI